MEAAPDRREDSFPEWYYQEVYIKQPQGFEVEDRKSHVCQLKKALYGLRQAPKAWYGRVAALYTPLGDVEEIFNPLGVSLGASES
jgi:hypothetical protein